jgi:hypothetical protein
MPGPRALAWAFRGRPGQGQQCRTEWRQGQHWLPGSASTTMSRSSLPTLRGKLGVVGHGGSGGAVQAVEGAEALVPDADHIAGLRLAG